MSPSELGDVGFIACALGALSFVITYSVVAPWWRTVAGRNVWAFAASSTFILLLGAYRLAFGETPAWDYVRLLAYGLLALSIWSAEVALVRVQILRHRATRDKEKS